MSKMKTLGAVLAILGLGLVGGCGNGDQVKPKALTGVISEVEKTQRLIYVDRKGFGSSNNIPIDVTPFRIGKERFILAGPNDIAKDDSVWITYKPDNLITAKEICMAFYPAFGGALKYPNVTFDADGYVLSLEKK